jgi:hypothetical protein
MRTITEAVERYILETERTYMKTNSGAFVLPIACDNAIFHAIVSTDDERRYVAVEFLAGVRVPAGRRREVAEWTVRANYRLRHGRFEFDFDAGDATFVTGIFVGGATLDEELLEPLFRIGLDVFDRYMPSLMKVAFGGTEAADAIDEVERPSPRLSESDFVELMEGLLADDDGSALSDEDERERG